MPIQELGTEISPLVLEDAQRVYGRGWFTRSRAGTWAYSEKHLHFGGMRVDHGDVYVLPQIEDQPAYYSSPCGICAHKGRRLGGGCEPRDSTCSTVLDASATNQARELSARSRVSTPDGSHITGEHKLINPRAGAWPDAVPLLCGSVKSWVSALDPNKDGRIQRAAYLAPYKAYRVVTIPKADGRVRKLHVPCGALMELQSRILERTLNRCVWPEHVAAYVPGRQLLDTARRHAGKPLVITLDLKNFFGSTTYRMVHDALVETYGYMALGAQSFLEKDDATSAARAVKSFDLLKQSQFDLKENDFKAAVAAVLYLTDAVTCPVDTRYPKSPRVLPQGAPTSGAFANLVGVHRLDPRVLAVCEMWGFTYSRYADDLIFSRDADLSREETTEFITQIVAAVVAAGYRVNWKKLRVQRRHQQQRVLGLVVNDGVPKVPRSTRMKLRAQHHFLVLHGVEAAAKRNLPPDMTFDDGVSPEEVFRRQHRGRMEYVRHVHEDHARGVLNLTPQQWNGSGY